MGLRTVRLNGIDSAASEVDDPGYRPGDYANDALADALCEATNASFARTFHSESRGSLALALQHRVLRFRDNSRNSVEESLSESLYATRHAFAEILRSAV